MSEQKKKKRIGLWILLGAVGLLIILAAIGPNQRVFTQDHLNTQFEKMVERNQRVNHLNPTSSITIDLQEGLGVLSITWEQGQTLTADIVVNEEGTDFDVENVQVPDAGLLEAFLEETGQRVIDSVLEEFVKSVPREVQRIEINEGEVVFVFRESH